MSSEIGLGIVVKNTTFTGFTTNWTVAADEQVGPHRCLASQTHDVDRKCCAAASNRSRSNLNCSRGLSACGGARGAGACARKLRVR